MRVAKLLWDLYSKVQKKQYWGSKEVFVLRLFLGGTCSVPVYGIEATVPSLHT